jgi:urease accessory protein
VPLTSSSPLRRTLPRFDGARTALLVASGFHAPFAAAHVDHSGGGLLAGLLHPLSGIGHLLAMVAVGIWGALLGAPLVWVLPVAFPLLMVIGGVLGIAGIALPCVEQGIALSVTVLGLAIAVAWRAPRPLAIAIVAVFALFHGYAHGIELPRAADPAAFASGFVVATGGLHLAGVGLGECRRFRHGNALLRAGGAAIAVVGVRLLLDAGGLA